TELITSAAENNLNNGLINFLIGSDIPGAFPIQDSIDQMTVGVSATFLGIAHMDCLLCHNGRGHLDTLNLWASQTTRFQAWQLASFLSHTQAQTNGGVWSLQDNSPSFTTDYLLNTTTGNRPARQPAGLCAGGQPCS